MSLFRNVEPDLRSLIAYIVARARERSITLTQTKLVKLLYLIDVERATSRRDPLTGLHWVFFHYGPYALELPETLNAMEGTEVITQQWKNATLYRAAPDAPDGEDWVSSTRRTVDRVIERFAPMGLNDLLDHVYFHTGPMIDAKRGEPLDLALAQKYSEPRRQAPLPPAAMPQDVEKRLARWRADTQHRLAPVQLEPPGRYFDDVGDDLGGEGTTGYIEVIDQSGL
jgi:uncharacterized phage-associated protein